MGVLDFTEFSEDDIKRFEDNTYENYKFDVYQFMNSRELTVEDVLWYQAYQGFCFLCEMPRKNEQTAAEIRRFLFKEKMHGGEKMVKMEGQTECQKYFLPDGSIYDNLTDSKLLNKMVALIRSGYKKCHIETEVVSLLKSYDKESHKIKYEYKSVNIAQTPSVIRKFLTQTYTNRDNLLRIAFALELKKDEFNRFLTNGSYLRELSVAVPKELIILYCIENENYDWNLVNDLLRYVEKCKIEPDGIDFSGMAALVNTTTEENLWAKSLRGMRVEQFKDDILRPCCHIAVSKVCYQNGNEVQYSKGALEKMREYSILKDKDQGMTNCVAPDDYETVFMVKTVKNYMAYFNIDEDYQNYQKSLPSNRIMSVDSYCRFLAYRMMMPNTKAHIVKFYRMKYGLLPTEIHDSLIKVSDIDQLCMEDGQPRNAHNISRYDILVAKFYFFLMKSWNEGRPFVSGSSESADGMWKQFFKGVNADLKDIGYPIISTKNPLDSMLRICMHSLCPLECYNRIYELDVLHSILNDPNGYNESFYPKKKRIQKVLEALERSYRKISRINDSFRPQYERVKKFCSDVAGKIVEI